MTTLIVAFHNFEKACKDGLNIRYLERDQTTDALIQEVRMLNFHQRSVFLMYICYERSKLFLPLSYKDTFLLHVSNSNTHIVVSVTTL